MRKSKWILLAALLLFAAPLLAQSAAPAKVGTLADFAWLEGQWRGDLQGPNKLVAEQTWSDAQGGVVHGMFRLLDPANGNRVVLLEYFTLRETPEGLELRLRHFNTALVPMEKEDAIILRLTKSDGTRFEFENPVHTRPKTSLVTRTGADAYTGRSEVINDAGISSFIEVTWKRVPAAAGKKSP